MTTKFFTNELGNTLLAKFSGVFSANNDIERFDALVGYLRASGYFSIRPHLEKVPRVRILVGINVDEIIAFIDADLYTQENPPIQPSDTPLPTNFYLTLPIYDLKNEN